MQFKRGNLIYILRTYLEFMNKMMCVCAKRPAVCEHLVTLSRETRMFQKVSNMDKGSNCIRILRLLYQVCHILYLGAFALLHKYACMPWLLHWYPYISTIYRYRQLKNTLTVLTMDHTRTRQYSLPTRQYNIAYLR
jgi:hypothetical protein